MLTSGEETQRVRETSVRLWKAVTPLGTCEGKQLGKAVSDLGAKSEIVSRRLQKESENLLMKLDKPLKDYIHAVQSIKVTMEERANAFKQHSKLAETIKLKEINFNTLLTQPGEFEKAENEFEELMADYEAAKQKFELIVSQVNEEIVQFQGKITLDMSHAFSEFAKGQADLANEIEASWRSLLPELEACAAEPASPT